MVRSAAEYVQARARLLDERRRLHEHQASMKQAGLDAESLERAMDPLRSFTFQRAWS